MCFGDQTTTTNTSSNTNTNTATKNQSTTGPDAWMVSEGQQNYSKASDVANQGYTPYQGERVADYGADWDQSANLIRGLTGSSQDLGTAGTILTSLKNSLDPNASVQSYMSPYLDATLTPQIRKINEAAGAQRNALNAQATVGGAFGDARTGVSSALLDRNTQQNISDATGNAYNQAWNQAQTQKNAVTSQLMQLASGFTGLQKAGDDRTSGIAKMLNTLATQQQQNQQAKDNVGYSNYLDQRSWDKNNLSWLSQILNSTPHNTNSSSSGTSQSNSNTNSVSETSKPDNTLGALLGQGVGALLSGGTSLLGGGSLLGGLFGGGGLGGLFGGSDPLNFNMIGGQMASTSDSDWL